MPEAHETIIIAMQMDIIKPEFAPGMDIKIIIVEKDGFVSSADTKTSILESTVQSGIFLDRMLNDRHVMKKLKNPDDNSGPSAIIH
jgi:hypothetical protein